MQEAPSVIGPWVDFKKWHIFSAKSCTGNWYRRPMKLTVSSVTTASMISWKGNFSNVLIWFSRAFLPPSTVWVTRYKDKLSLMEIECYTLSCVVIFALKGCWAELLLNGPCWDNIQEYLIQRYQGYLKTIPSLGCLWWSFTFWTTIVGTWNVSQRSISWNVLQRSISGCSSSWLFYCFWKEHKRYRQKE